MELHSEGKPLVQTLVDYFDEVRYQNFERRVFLLLDAVMRGKEVRMSENQSDATEAPTAAAETVEGDQIVNEAPEAPEAPDAPEPADPSGDTEGGDTEGGGESEAGDSESND